MDKTRTAAADFARIASVLSTPLAPIPGAMLMHPSGPLRFDFASRSKEEVERRMTEAEEKRARRRARNIRNAAAMEVAHAARA